MLICAVNRLLCSHVHAYVLDPFTGPEQTATKLCTHYGSVRSSRVDHCSTQTLEQYASRTIDDLRA